MNRAASFLWATTVALVLSASAHAEQKIVKFPTPVKMSASGSKRVGSAETVDVPTQIIRNRAANRQAQVRPRAGARIPRNVTKINYKKALKFNPARAITGVVIAGAVGAVGWVMSPENTELQKPDYTYDTSLTLFWCGQSSEQYCNGSNPLTKRYSSPGDAKPSLDDFFCAQYGASTCAPGTVTSTLSVSGSQAIYNWSFPVVGQTYKISGGANLYRFGSCKPGFIYINSTGQCQSPTPDYGPVTDSDLDQLVGSVDSMDDAKLGALFDELALVDPAFGMLMPEYLRSASGATAEQLATNPLITNTARLNPDGTVSRLTKTEQTTFDIAYPESGNTFNYTVTNKTTITNEAGEKVEEQTETEEGAEEAPELSTSLESANDPLKDWATSLSDAPAATTPGISYPLLFTYGGTCSLAPVSLPYFGTYGLDPICKAINDYVKPILGILFAAWTILHIFGVWRETTMHVRPS